MSFSGDVKEELSRQVSSARHCCIAEIAAIVNMCGHIKIGADNGMSVRITTENLAVARKFDILLRKTFGIHAEIAIRQSAYLSKNKTYTVIVTRHKDALLLLKATKIFRDEVDMEENVDADSIIIRNTCCKRAFVRGAFLASGSISDPEKSYHFEIVTAYEERARQIRDVIQFFQIDAKIVERKKHYVVYIKESSGIVDILNVMEAHVCLMNLENIRIVKDVRNTVNRKVNCETANINKTVTAAVKQINDIEYIRDNYGLERLPEQLYELAVVRLQNPEVPLSELGKHLTTPIGKSGVNHRLRRISEFATDLKGGKNDI